jgi:hypothetical protein
MPPATTSAQAMTNLNNYTAGMLSPEQELQKEESGLGVQADQQQVQGLQGAIQNTTTLLNNVAPSVMGRTANSLETSAQADREIGNEQAPINTQLNNDNSAYNTANTNYTNALGQAETLAQGDQTAEQNEQSYLQNIYSNLYTKEQNASALAEQQREFNAQEADTKAANAASGVGSPSLDLGGLGGTGTPGGSSAASSGDSMGRNSVGGYEFTNAQGQPVTMGAYLVSRGATPQNILNQVVSLLRTSKSGGDLGIANAIASGHYSTAQLEKLYPQVFGGM